MTWLWLSWSCLFFCWTDTFVDFDGQKLNSIWWRRKHFSIIFFSFFFKNCSKKKNWICTYHPPCRVSVKPNRESRSTDTRIPMIPNPCGVITWPRITDTRLHIGINPQTNKRKSRKKRRKWFGKNAFVSWVIWKSIRIKTNVKKKSYFFLSCFHYNVFTFWLKIKRI